jgi:hypothetical protein
VWYGTVHIRADGVRWCGTYFDKCNRNWCGVRWRDTVNTEHEESRVQDPLTSLPLSLYRRTQKMQRSGDRSLPLLPAQTAP